MDALRLDLIGPRPSDEVLQRERLPQAPSRWHLSRFLVPSDAPQGQRAQHIEEEIDELIEPSQGETMQGNRSEAAPSAPFSLHR